MKPVSSRARSYVRSRTELFMENTCRIERVLKPSYDEETLVGTPGGRTTIYEGVCRIWEVSGPGVVMLGEEEYSTQGTNLSIPWDATPVPTRHDEGVVTSSESDPEMVGKRFVILDVAKAGQLRATRRFSIQLKQGSTQA